LPEKEGIDTNLVFLSFSVAIAQHSLGLAGISITFDTPLCVKFWLQDFLFCG